MAMIVRLSNLYLQYCLDVVGSFRYSLAYFCLLPEKLIATAKFILLLSLVKIVAFSPSVDYRRHDCTRYPHFLFFR